MARHRSVSSRRHKSLRKHWIQRGVLAIEFAFIFPAFFLIFYAIITYSLVFVAQQTLSLAAAEGARAAVRYQSQSQARLTTSCATALQPLSWIQAGTSCNARNLPSADCPNGATCVEVIVRYDYAAHPLIPQLLGPYLALPVPTRLQGHAVAQYSTVT